MRFGRIAAGSGSTYCEVGDGTIAAIDGDPFTGTFQVGPSRPAGEVELLMPLQPAKLLVVLGAFPAKRTRDEARAVPPRFSAKAISAMEPNFGTIVVPEWVQTPVYVEPELAVVIGRRLKNATASEAEAAIFGFTAFNDTTLMESIVRDRDYFTAKSMDTFGSIGSWITTDLTAADVADGLRLEAFVNDRLVHEGNTRDFTHTLAETLVAASRVVTLWPGDLISLGTPPDPQPVARGDVVRIEVEGAGSVVSTVG